MIPPEVGSLKTEEDTSYYFDEKEPFFSLDDSRQRRYTDSGIRENWVLQHNTQFLQKQLSYKWNGENLFIPTGTAFEHTVTIAGAGVDTKIRVINRLVSDYGGNIDNWMKKAGKISSDKYIFDVHWYEHDGIQYEVKLKSRSEKKG